MARRRCAAILAGTFCALVSGALAAGSFAERLRALEPTIGHYPAEIQDKSGERAVKAQYEALKKDIDAALSSSQGRAAAVSARLSSEHGA